MASVEFCGNAWLAGWNVPMPSKKVILLCGLLGTLAMVNVWYRVSPVRREYVYSQISYTKNEDEIGVQFEDFRVNGSEEFGVHTEHCWIRLRDTLPKSQRKHFEQWSRDACKMPHGSPKPLFRTRMTSNRTCPLLDEDVLGKDYSATAADLACVYQPVMRDTESQAPDRNFKIGKSFPFNWTVCPHDLEIQISCNITPRHDTNNSNGKSSEYEQFLLMTSVVDLQEPLSVRPKQRPSFNVMVLGIDALSRLAFHRTMPKTLQQLQRLYGERLVELLGFNKVGENSAPNQIPFLTGRPFSHDVDMLDHRYFDNWANYVWDEYRRKGYRTLFLEELGKWGLFTYPNRMGFKKIPTDYWPRSLMLAVEKRYPYNCYFNQTQSSVFLKYLEDTMQLLTRNRPLFVYAWISLETHGNLRGGWQNDDDIANHFNSLHDSGILNHTIVLLLADHGYRMGWFRKTPQGTLEDMLPFAFVLLPDEFVQLRPDSLRILRMNSRRLVTPYDIHATLQDLTDPLDPGIHLDSSSHEINYTSPHYGVSLLSEVVPRSRTCRQAGILDQFCSCYRYVSETDSKLWPAFGDYVVDAVNKILDDTNRTATSKGCSKFTLDKSLEVQRMFEGKTFFQKYKVRISTRPDAVFEALVEQAPTTSDQQSDLTFSALPRSIVRVDQYSEHSKCAKGERFERYCYCK